MAKILEFPNLLKEEIETIYIDNVELEDEENTKDRNIIMNKNYVTIPKKYEELYKKERNNFIKEYLTIDEYIKSDFCPDLKEKYKIREMQYLFYSFTNELFSYNKNNFLPNKQECSEVEYFYCIIKNMVYFRYLNKYFLLIYTEEEEGKIFIITLKENINHLSIINIEDFLENKNHKNYTTYLENYLVNNLDNIKKEFNIDNDLYKYILENIIKKEK